MMKRLCFAAFMLMGGCGIVFACNGGGRPMQGGPASGMTTNPGMVYAMQMQQLYNAQQQAYSQMIYDQQQAAQRQAQEQKKQARREIYLRQNAEKSAKRDAQKKAVILSQATSESP